MTEYNVLVVCAAGMSSSLLESKTKAAALACGHGLNIHALSVCEIAAYDFNHRPVDMVLVAPQVRYKKRNITEMASPYGVIVQDIDPMTFGMVDGDRLFEQISKAVVKE